MAFAVIYWNKKAVLQTFRNRLSSLLLVWKSKILLQWKCHFYISLSWADLYPCIVRYLNFGTMSNLLKWYSVDIFIATRWRKPAWDGSPHFYMQERHLLLFRDGFWSSFLSFSKFLPYSLHSRRALMQTASPAHAPPSQLSTRLGKLMLRVKLRLTLLQLGWK